MKRLFRRRTLKITFLAFATSLFLVPAASAMPMPSDPAAASHTSYRTAQPVTTDGWYTAALQMTRDSRPLTDGWYTATVKTPQTAQPAVKLTPGSDGFAWRDAGIAFALGLLLTAVLTAGILRARRERHVPILQ